MNNIVISGNLGADPEIKYFESGAVVAKFPIAVRRRKKKGEEQKPLWMSAEVWGEKLANVAYTYLKKGDNVCVSGEVDLNVWINSNSEAQGRIIVNVSNLDLPSKRQSEECGEDDEEWDRGSQQTTQRQPVAAGKTKTVEPAPEVDYDDIPF